MPNSATELLRGTDMTALVLDALTGARTPRRRLPGGS